MYHCEHFCCVTWHIFTPLLPRSHVKEAGWLGGGTTFKLMSRSFALSSVIKLNMAECPFCVESVVLLNGFTLPRIQIRVFVQLSDYQGWDISFILRDNWLNIICIILLKHWTVPLRLICSILKEKREQKSSTQSVITGVALRLSLGRAQCLNSQ